MDRAEAAGIGIAVAGHGALILALSLALAATQALPPSSAPMEVTFEEETGPVSTAPLTEEAPAPSLGEEMGPTEQASGAEAAVPAPLTAPVPEPVRPPVEFTERRRPDVTRDAVPVRRQAQPQPQPQRQPAPQRPQPQAQPRRQSANPGQGQAQRSTGFDPRRIAELIGRGPPEARGSSPAPPAQLSGAQQQQLARNISGLIAPCASRAPPPNGLARSISVDLRVTVDRNGNPLSHQLLRSAGTDASNQGYVNDVVDVAMRAVRACSSRIATLPDEYYAVPNGWRTFTYRFRFP